jgi:fatty acid desaturase
MAGDARAARNGDARVRRGWLWHVPALVPVALWLAYVAAMPVWAYLVAAYMGLSIVKIRTFLEHQAHQRASGRTVIIEDRGPLAFLFLNNNLHVVHHMHPRVAWYRLPQLYAAHRARYIERNGGYVFRSYAQIFRQYLFRAKDPVPHPFWR